jgi:hypothetical protein
MIRSFYINHPTRHQKPETTRLDLHEQLGFLNPHSTPCLKQQYRGKTIACNRSPAKPCRGLTISSYHHATLVYADPHTACLALSSNNLTYFGRLLFSID